ncbi:hypothetical protein ACFWH1_18730 [Streptomyces sp. NPDC127037]|uniref:hypothetical protein n=1 Tax=Streptomyces sp. NPDC127037 TaxID=3347113 RepID=UPI0036546F5F
MNPDFLPAIGASLRALCEFATRHDVDDRTLADLAAELDRARLAVKGARGEARANRCAQHPGGPVDPTARNGCLLCGPAERRPARPIGDDFVPGDVLRFLEEHGHEAAAREFGPQSVTRALAVGRRHPATQRPGTPTPPSNEGAPDAISD